MPDETQPEPEAAAQGQTPSPQGAEGDLLAGAKASAERKAAAPSRDLTPGSTRPRLADLLKDPEFRAELEPFLDGVISRANAKIRQTSSDNGEHETEGERAVPHQGEPRNGRTDAALAEVQRLRDEIETERRDQRILKNLRVVAREDGISDEQFQHMNRYLADEAKKPSPRHDFLLLESGPAAVRRVLEASGAYDLPRKPVMPGGSDAAAQHPAQREGKPAERRSGVPTSQDVDRKISEKMDKLADRLAPGWRRFG